MQPMQVPHVLGQDWRPEYDAVQKRVSRQRAVAHVLRLHIVRGPPAGVHAKLYAQIIVGARHKGCLRIPAGSAEAGAGRTAADVMNPLVFSVMETTELSRAIGMMSDGGFHQVPVVMGDGTVVVCRGIVVGMDPR